ncbi:MAG: hypothetical protein ACK4MV_04075 [Beijerinckiaceae bacterium]
MRCKAGRTLALALGVAAAAATLMVSETAINGDGLLSSGAEARVGRPMTPMSYAGVARRTTARAVTYGAAAGAAAYGATVVPGQCVQSVDAYGRVYTQCY